MQNNSTVQVAIIGAGPAGIAAAVQLKRYAIDFIIFDSNGSLLKNAYQIENYLGLTAGIAGTELLAIFKQQLLNNNIAPIKQKVAQADYLENKQLFKITTANNAYFASYLIIASGTKPKTHPLLATLSTTEKNKIDYEVYPYLASKNKKFAILGAGDAAFDYALSLLNNNQVAILNHGEQIKALPCLRAEVFNHKNFSYFTNVDLPNFITTENSYDYLLIAIGRTPQKDFYTVNLEKLEQKLLNSSKLYLIGDVKNAIYRQTAIAVGDGIKAAMQIFKGNNL
jgi:thioredoxin reductase (NADPH)